MKTKNSLVRGFFRILTCVEDGFDNYFGVIGLVVNQKIIAVKHSNAFDFFGINLGAIPDWKFWAWDVFNWAHIGAFLIPLVSTGSQLMQMWISQKMNNSVITNEKGVQDKETAKNSQMNQSNKVMMYVSMDGLESVVELCDCSERE